MTQKSKAITLLILCQILALSLWFSASATLADLKQNHNLSDLVASFFSSMVAIGFICGTLTSVLFSLPDRFDPRRLFMISALIGAIANAGLLVISPADPTVLICRFITGFAMAGVYPIGIKMTASWAKKDMGLLVGLLVGALTLGSALPHMFNALGGVEWTLTITAASLAATLAALLVNAVPIGPNYAKSAVFHPRKILMAWTDKPLRLANFGYLGHMWELYAMWAWIGIFLNASFRQSNLPDADYWANVATFVVIGTGAIGCFAGGWLADRIGRTALTSGAMALSGTSALIVGLCFGGPLWILIPVCLIWGISIIADSAQFSSCIAELSPPEDIGTMVTVQTCVGFTLTLITIHAIPYWVEMMTWQWAFAPLAIGPFFGIWAMLTLRRHPDAVKLAHGKK